MSESENLCPNKSLSAFTVFDFNKDPRGFSTRSIKAPSQVRPLVDIIELHTMLCIEWDKICLLNKDLKCIPKCINGNNSKSVIFHCK